MKRVAIIGCGDISSIYLENLTGQFKDRLEVAGVCDLIDERQQRQAKKYGIGKIYKDMHEAFADPSVDVILNITRPYDHFEVTSGALNAGKHVYCEKPLGANLEEGQKLRALAAEKGLLIGGAPDTFLGAGIQTCRKLIDEGVIGDIIGANAFMLGRGHETWHPDPEFYYKSGGGPMLDMGPYYITALVSLIGAVKRVTGTAKASFPTRTITSQPHSGTVITVDVPTHYAGVIEFENGAVGTIVTSYDVHPSKYRNIEIYGSKGTLYVPDPNMFGDPVSVYTAESGQETAIPHVPDYIQNSRGLGLYDMVRHIEDGTPFRASGDLIFHVLEVMTGFERAYKAGGFVEMTTAPARPARLA